MTDQPPGALPPAIAEPLIQLWNAVAHAGGSCKTEDWTKADEQLIVVQAAILSALQRPQPETGNTIEVEFRPFVHVDVNGNVVPQAPRQPSGEITTVVEEAIESAVEADHYRTYIEGWGDRPKHIEKRDRLDHEASEAKTALLAAIGGLEEDLADAESGAKGSLLRIAALTAERDQLRAEKGIIEAGLMGSRLGCARLSDALDEERQDNETLRARLATLEGAANAVVAAAWQGEVGQLGPTIVALDRAARRATGETK